jgi:hypothetical protein
MTSTTSGALEEVVAIELDAATDLNAFPVPGAIR